MGKFKYLNRVLKRMFKKNRRRKKRRARQDDYNESRGWSAIWRRRRPSIATNGSTRSRKLLPSLLSFFKRKNNRTIQRDYPQKQHDRGGRLLRLMSSFTANKDNTACTQWSHDEDNEIPSTHDSYILSLGGIHILVEASCHQTDHTPTDNADNTTTDCHSLSAAEPNPAVTTQEDNDLREVPNISPVSSTLEELDVSSGVIPLDWESSLESLVFSEKPLPVLLENPSVNEICHQTSPEIRQSTKEQNITHQLVCRMESDDETISQIQQSIAKIERISHLFCYPDNETSSVCIEQDNKANSFITCSWQWITAVSIVFVILLLA